MNKSESIKNIAGALVNFQATVSKVSKESKNPFFKSKYASLANILDTIQKPLSECGLAITQFPDGDALTTLIVHAESGEWMESSYVMPVAKQNDPQAMGSAITMIFPIKCVFCSNSFRIFCLKIFTGNNC